MCFRHVERDLPFLPFMAEKAETEGGFRKQWLSSLVLLPMLDGLGHLAPAVGASWAAIGTPVFDVPILLLLFSVHTLVDSYDKYKDMPRASRPPSSLALLWLCSFLGIAGYTTYLCGIDIAMRLLRFLALEVLWPTPSIPTYSRKKGFRLIKLKDAFGPFKSIFCGVCAGWMDANPATARACALHPDLCRPDGILMRSLAYSILYNFIRENACDTRDIDEDEKEGLLTLPVALGKKGSKIFLAAVALCGEMAIGGGQLSTESVLRVVVTLAFTFAILRQPRENGIVWGSHPLLGLLPACWAQSQLAAEAGMRQLFVA